MVRITACGSGVVVAAVSGGEPGVVGLGILGLTSIGGVVVGRHGCCAWYRSWRMKVGSGLSSRIVLLWNGC